MTSDVNTLARGGQIESLWGKRQDLELRARSRNLYSISQHSTTWWSDRVLVMKETGLRAQRWNLYSTSRPVNTVPRGGQIESSRGKRRGLELNAENSIPPVNTVPRGGHWDWKLVRKEAGLRVERWKLYSTSQHSSTWWSNWKLAKKEAGLWYQR